VDNVRKLVRDFIIQESYVEDLRDDALVLEDGTLDSMTLVRLVGVLIRELDIKIDAHEVTAANFGSVNAIVDFVTGRLSRTA
jgi:acyl carrier protein